jgi:hypothetical protein
MVLASNAGLAPTKEPLIPHSSLRGDILIRSGVSWRLVDVAVVNGLCDTNISAAVSSVGGAATAYTQKKHAHYGPAATAAGRTVMPMVVDTFGAWDPAALGYIRTMCSAAGERLGLPAHRRVPRFMRILQLALARGVAQVLVRNTPACAPLCDAVGPDKG